MVTKRCGTCKKYKSLDDFYNLKSSPDGKYWRCRDCDKINQKKTRTSERNHGYNIKKYGITSEDYERMLVQQSGGCAVCGGTSKKGSRLAVDHSHETGEVRGLLCDNCNRAIGLLQDNSDLLRLAATYLDRRIN